MRKIVDFLRNNLFLRRIYFFTVAILMYGFYMNAAENSLDILEVETQNELIKIELSKKRGLLIFLDEKEKDAFGALSLDLMTALYQEAGPIIVSTSLFCTILEHQAKDQRPVEILLDEIEKLTPQSPFRKEKNDILLSKISFQPRQWIIKKINSSLTLLIPQRYLGFFNMNKGDVEANHVHMNLSDVELRLGFKVNHMETIDIEKIIRPAVASNSDYFIDSLSSIFCKKLDYLGRNINLPEWSLFIIGHGRPVDDKTGPYTYKTVGLSLHGFQNLLHFLENKIETQLLTILSCYAAGVHSKKIYGEIKSETQHTYSFPIIVQALNDVTARAHSISIDWKAWRSNKVIKLETYKNFYDFLAKATGLQEGDYREIIKPILGDFVSNIPQIKLPGVEWFSILECDKKVVSIGSILAQTKNPQTPLNIVSYFRKDPEVILLYTDDIPFELKINSDKVESIVSMVSSGPIQDKPDFVIHHIKKISSSQTWEKIFQWFNLVAKSTILEHGSKWFFIDEINDSWRNVIIFGTDLHKWKIYGDYFVEMEFGEYWIPYTLELKEEYGKVHMERKTMSSEEEVDYRKKIKVALMGYAVANIEAREGKEIGSAEMKKIEDVLQQGYQTRKREKQNVLEPK